MGSVLQKLLPCFNLFLLISFLLMDSGRVLLPCRSSSFCGKHKKRLQLCNSRSLYNQLVSMETAKDLDLERLLIGMYRNLAGPHFLSFWQRQGQDAVFVVGLDLVGIDCCRQGNATPEAAKATLP